MDQRLAVSRRDAYVEVLGDGGEFFLGRGGEIPMEKFFFGVLSGVGTSIATQHLRSVVRRVEADAEEMSLLIESGVGGQCLIHFGEVPAHSRTEIGKGTAGIDEGKQDDFALELRQVNGAIALVEQFEVGYSIANLWNVVLDGRFVVRARLGGDDDIVETDVREVIVILICEDRGHNAITGVKFRGDDRIFQFVRHGHRLHKAGDSLSVESDVCGVGADDLTAYPKRGLRGSGTGGRRGRGLTAAREESDKHKYEQGFARHGGDSFLDDNGRDLAEVLWLNG